MAGEVGAVITLRSICGKISMGPLRSFALAK